jgi:hypothetical protein
MTSEPSAVTIRFLERTSNQVVYEAQDWANVNFTERHRRFGQGHLTVPLRLVPPEVVDLHVAENLALWVRHRLFQPDFDGGDTTRIDTIFTGPVGGGIASTRDDQWQFWMNDNLVYLNDRVVNTDGVAHVDVGSVPAAEYIRTHLNNQLLAPTDGDRAIDIPAELAGAPSVGGTVNRPVRWQQLDAVVEQACIIGAVGVRATLSGKTVQFSVVANLDRTAGSGAGVGPVSKALTGSDLQVTYNHRPVKNRAYVLGQGEGAARTVRTRTASSVPGRLREAVVDARHLSANADLDDWGDAFIAENAEPEVEVQVTNVQGYADIRPGMTITVQENVSSEANRLDIGPLDLLVLSRTFNLSPDSADEITLGVGHETLTAAQLFRQLARRSEQATNV